MLDTSILGFLGTAFVIFAYVPQMRHLLQKHCSQGVSVRARRVYLIGSILLLLHAIQISDIVFIALQFFQSVALMVVLFLTYKFRTNKCVEYTTVP